MIILGIETSCDECAISVVKDGKEVLSNIIYSQKIHELYGGVVPEIAGREHLLIIRDVFNKAITDASQSPFYKFHDNEVNAGAVVKIKNTRIKNIYQDTDFKSNQDTDFETDLEFSKMLASIDAIAVSQTPGLIGSLIVGFNFAKSLSLSLKKPFIGINHIHAHIYASHLEHQLHYPYMSLLLSGGHSLISYVKDYNDIQVLGTTIDDSCGEVFDKVAKFYNLGYPGGPAVDKLAKEGNMLAYSFPIPKVHGYNMSYSGLKNAVINQTDKFYRRGQKSKADIIASFQKVAIDSALSKLFTAMEDYNCDVATIGGGVGANSYLRERISNIEKKSIKHRIHLPSKELCTDNGAMVAGLGYHYIKNGVTSKISDVANPRKIRG